MFISLSIFVIFIPESISESSISRKWSDNVVIASNIPPSIIYSENTAIKEVQEMIVYYSNIYNVKPSLALKIIECEGGFLDSKKCNKDYGCDGGIGHWQFIYSTWNDTVIEMSKLNILPIKCRDTESVFDSECNIMVGCYLLSVDGTDHWGVPDDTTWGSYSCWISEK